MAQNKLFCRKLPTLVGYLMPTTIESGPGSGWV
jgi:hypothetical protein